MSYCDGLCKNLEERKHKCTKYNKKLGYVKYKSKSYSYTTHEQCTECAEDEANSQVEGESEE